LEHPDAKAENRERGGEGKNEAPEIDACEHRRGERQPKAVHGDGLTEERMDREPDSEVEHNADNGGGDRRQCAR